MYYKKHAFFCTNKKADGSGCGHLSNESSFGIAKMHLQATDMWGEGKVRVSKSGCLGRCDEGPVCVVYPDNVWYGNVTVDDVETIMEEHIEGGNVVSSLEI